MTCADAEKLIDKILAQSLRTSDWSALRAHATTCDACRHRYDRAVLAERMLEGGLDAIARPSALELDRIGLSVLDATARKESLWSRAKGLLPASPMGFTAWVASAAVVLFFAVPLLKHAEPEFQSRGTQTPAMQGGVRVLCIAADGNVRETPHRCALDEQMKFLVSNHGYRWLFLVGVDEGHEVLWYAPRPPSTTSVPIADGVDLPTGPTIRVGVNHRPGKLRVLALFSQSPIAAAEIERAVKTTDKALMDPQQLLSFGKSDLEQRSLIVEIAP